MEYVPDQGHIVWITFTPQAGNEQAGRRPALALTPAAYNLKVGLGIFCPVTSQVKGYPFEVAIPPGLPVSGVILSDQVKSLDWRMRNAEFACPLPGYVIEEVKARLSALLQH